MFENTLALVFAEYYKYTLKQESPVSFFKYMLGER